MSRSLPSRPNLEHLRKQAKALLVELRRQHPETRLAGAQRRLARAPGFSAWAALKAHVIERTAAGAADEPSAPARPHPLDGIWRADPSRSTFPPEATHGNAILHLGSAVAVVVRGRRRNRRSNVQVGSTAVRG